MLRVGNLKLGNSTKCPPTLPSIGSPKREGCRVRIKFAPRNIRDMRLLRYPFPCLCRSDNFDVLKRAQSKQVLVARDDQFGI